jgi:hypothetical protein
MLCVVAPFDHIQDEDEVEVKVTLPPIQNVKGPSAVIIGIAGKESTSTVVVEAKDVPHPVAFTLIVATPEKAGDHDTVPVVPVPEIVFPVPVTDQV